MDVAKYFLKLRKLIYYREYSDAHGDRQTNKQTNTRAYVGSTTCESAKVNLFAFYRALFRKSDTHTRAYYRIKVGTMYHAEEFVDLRWYVIKDLGARINYQ